MIRPDPPNYPTTQQLPSDRQNQHVPPLLRPCPPSRKPNSLSFRFQAPSSLRPPISILSNLFDYFIQLLAIQSLPLFAHLPIFPIYRPLLLTDSLLVDLIVLGELVAFVFVLVGTDYPNSASELYDYGWHGL